MAKVRFPISAKLLLIITIILMVSLGTACFLVWFMLSADAEGTALENNNEVNSMAVHEAETVLSAVRSAVPVFLYNIEAGANIEANTESFFRNNSDIALILSLERTAEHLGIPYINEDFFLNNELDSAMTENILTEDFYRSRPGKALLAALDDVRSGKMTVLNAAPVFGIPMLAIIFPCALPHGSVPVITLVSSASITESYGSGAYSSFLIDTRGNVLVHPNTVLVREDAGFADEAYIQDLLEALSASEQSIIYIEDNVAAVRGADSEGNEYFAAARPVAQSGMVAVTAIPADVVFEGVTATTRRNIYLSAAAWFLGVLVIWYAARSLSRPLVALREAAEAIEDGRYHLELKMKNHDETGLLTASVIGMSLGLENFEKFTNKSIARLSRSGKLATGGADKQATVFFSDIRSFTAISEKMKPTEVVEFLNDYMDRMVASVILTGGTIDKFIGDAVMAHWGAVESAGSPELDALAGIRAALLMRASLAAFNEGRGSEEKPIIKIGKGLNSGPVVAGQIGSEERLEFTIIGDTVSFADRTETFNKLYGTEILMTEHTWRLAGDRFITEEMPPVMQHGKSVRIFAVINTADPIEGMGLLHELDRIPRTIPEVSRRCIGPEGPQNLAELRTLLGIPTPDLSKVNTDEEEKKYKVKA
ncbi:adenylate/guanylate cyclase domain-containing protein [Spirochaetia bacterium]|nr:adenylate/guanylate cyclase domain-containing protein [Spirochaetia bacterium]